MPNEKEESEANEGGGRLPFTAGLAEFLPCSVVFCGLGKCGD